MVGTRVWKTVGRSIAVAVALIAVGCRTTPPPPPDAPLPPGQRIVVERGQTVLDIARETGVSVEEIVEVNGLRSANEIAVGQVLFVPAPPMAVLKPRPVTPTPTPTPPPKATPVPPTTTAPDPVAVLGWPTNGVVLRDFVAGGGKKAPYDGILIAAPAGTEVRSARDGIVAFAGTQGTRLGTLVVVDHGGEFVTVYGHLGRAKVKAGQHVDRGDVVGVVGTSGLIGVSPRVYFEVRQERAPVDPLPLLPP